MDIVSLFKTAYTAIILNKTRSFLTSLGIIIGVASVILLVSLGNGLQATVTEQFDSLGTNLVIILPGKVNVGGGGNPATSFGNNKLSEREVKNIESDLRGEILAITPGINFGVTATYRGNEVYTAIRAGYASIETIRNVKVDKGRFYTEAENKSNAKVAIIGTKVVDEIFAGKNPLGETIELEGKRFKVIGIKEQEGAFGGEDNDNIIYIPYNTTKSQFPKSALTGIFLKTKEEIDPDLVIKHIERSLQRTIEEDDFTVLTQEELLESIQTILGSITLALGGIAAISLIVGGVGIMNIMLVSVTERTREIGLRKAVGATPNVILFQFLLEAVLLSFIGGVVGILLGAGLSSLIDQWINTEVPLWSVGLAFGFSALVGIVFGTAPALKAARKDPIEALRYE